MCYRETAHYVVLCDRCGLAAPEGTGWWTPSHADRAALEAGWEISLTEHLCPLCAPRSTHAPSSTADVADDAAGAVNRERAALPPAVETSTRLDICWPPPSAGAARSREESR